MSPRRRLLLVLVVLSAALLVAAAGALFVGSASISPSAATAIRGSRMASVTTRSTDSGAARPVTAATTARSPSPASGSRR